MNKKGMTLVEQVVVMAIVAIFSLVAVSLLSGAFSVSQRVMAQSEAAVISSNVAQVVKDRISVGKDVTVTGSGDLSVDGNIISSKGGYLTINGNLHFAPSYYTGNILVLAFENVTNGDGASTGTIKFQVEIKSENSIIYTGEYICSTVRSKL